MSVFHSFPYGRVLLLLVDDPSLSDDNGRRNRISKGFNVNNELLLDVKVDLAIGAGPVDLWLSIWNRRPFWWHSAVNERVDEGSFRILGKAETRSRVMSPFLEVISV